MNCAVHTDREATGYCRHCGKALCPECTREVRGALYCEDCLANQLAAPYGAANSGGAAAPVPRDTNPALAATLGFIPGLGAVYNGEYTKALIQVVIFGGLIAIHNSEMGDMNSGSMAFIHIALACFYFYMPIDSYRVAKARRAGQAEPSPLVDAKGARPIGAFVLIFVGVLFLLSNFGLLQTEWFEKAWPLGLIALGGWLVWDRTRTHA